MKPNIKELDAIYAANVKAIKEKRPFDMGVPCVNEGGCCLIAERRRDLGGNNVRSFGEVVDDCKLRRKDAHDLFDPTDEEGEKFGFDRTHWMAKLRRFINSLKKKGRKVNK